MPPPLPQGSGLGPLLFVIYINDLPGISKLAQFILYADDANIIVTGNNMDEILEKVNRLIPDLVHWVDSNGLALNLKKTNYMIFTKQRNNNTANRLELSINGIPIERKTEARFLGVIIDEKLTWTQHIAALRMKMARYLGVMYKIKSQLPIQARLQIYHSFIQSHLNYCSLVWGFAAKSRIESLFSKQKQGLRAIIPGFVNYYYDDGNLPTHTKQFFKEYEILTVHGIILKNLLILMHKIKHFPLTLPKSIIGTMPANLPTVGSDHVTSADWLELYSNVNYRSSIFYKGPLLAISSHNTNITTLPTLFSIKLYKASVKRLLLELQCQGSDDNCPNFLLYNIPGLRSSPRNVPAQQ